MNPIEKLVTVLAITAFAFTAEAQTVTVTGTNASGGTTTTTAPVSFFQSVGAYFTSANTNLSFTTNDFEFSDGVSQIGGVMSDQVEAQKDFGNWDISASLRDAGVGGVIETFEAGGGYKVINYYDTAVTAAVEGGYDFNRGTLIIEPKIYARKKLTTHTFAEVGVSLPEWLKGGLNKTPGFFVGAGFDY